MRFAVPLTLSLLAVAAHAAPLQIKANGYSAEVTRGAVTSLVDAAGNVFVDGPIPDQTCAIRTIGGDHWSRDDEAPATVEVGQVRNQTYDTLTDTLAGLIQTRYQVEEDTDDLIITQSCRTTESGVWGVEWNIAYIPLEMDIIIPGRSGIKLSADSPFGTQTFDYPLAWEAQLVIVEGEGRGFYVWAGDPDGMFKRLTVDRTDEGWRLGFASINNAPFDDRKDAVSPIWHVNVYEGDWRVPARTYRDWMVENLRPTLVQDQGPEWVKDIRCVVIMGMDIPTIEDLTERLDPEQTLLYIPGWRKAGYDRDYPVYDDPFPQFEPFVKRAHELGYRVMPHVNYFGVDPLNELYEQFEPYQVRDPWGNHDKLWWLWTRAEPEIKFAYINPAHKPWRDLFVARMKEFCERYEIDAIHLDQTLCIFNDNNGLMDGMSMSQGNVAIHKELREAIPQVALSGEGLNEVAYRYEAFAQRHAWGLVHHEGTWNRSQLDCAHPIASYLLRPYTIIYGYLGYTSPDNGQLYAAWNDAYQSWGVIPTLKPNRRTVENPTGFTRQFYDEVEFWQDQRLDIDVDADWPDDIAFPYRTASGERVVKTKDRRTVIDGDDIIRTISEVTETALPGSIPGWRVYNAERIFGLDPRAWYAYVDEPRDMDAFHIEGLTEGFRVSMVTVDEDMAIVRTEQVGGVVADLTESIGKATCGSIPVNGPEVETRGPLFAEDGSHFRAEGSVLHAHPPWKTPGSGVAYARYEVTLPAAGNMRFVTEVAMDSSAAKEETADGVTFGVTVRSGGDEEHVELHNASEVRRPLEIDLTPFAGRTIQVELTVHPGPDDAPSFDWARWYEPRVEQDTATTGEIVVGGGQDWDLAFSGAASAVPEREGDIYRLPADLPGATVLTADIEMLPVALPFDVAAAPLRVSFAGSDGQALVSPQFAGANALDEPTAVGGVAKPGIHAHPPDHGMTIASLPLSLPTEAAELHSFVGLRDGSKSEGCVFSIQANGVEIARELMVPGEWHELAADLEPWAGKDVIISLVTDSDGEYGFDWAVWGTPVIRAR